MLLKYTPESELTIKMFKKRNTCFYSSNTVVTETMHLITADIVTMNQLSSMAK